MLRVRCNPKCYPFIVSGELAMTPYEEGREARRNGEKSDANPYLGEVSKAGVQRDKVGFGQAATDWRLGMRDQNDELTRQWPRMSKRKSNRHYGG